MGDGTTRGGDSSADDQQSSEPDFSERKSEQSLAEKWTPGEKQHLTGAVDEAQRPERSGPNEQPAVDPTSEGSDRAEVEGTSEGPGSSDGGGLGSDAEIHPNQATFETITGGGIESVAAQGRPESMRERYRDVHLGDDPLQETGRGVPSVVEFAGQTFPNGVVADHIVFGHDGYQATRRGFDMDQRFVGGWADLDPETDIANFEELGAKGQVGGRTENYMYVAGVAETADVSGTEAYVTMYDHDDVGVRAPTKANAHSQLGTFAVLDAMGVQQPAHVYDSENKTMYVESVGKEDYDATVLDSSGVPSEYVDKIDRDSLVYTVAVNWYVGNTDLGSDNIIVGEGGRVHTFDNDFTIDRQPAEVVTNGRRNLTRTVNRINELRDNADNIQIEVSEVTDCIEDIADGLVESGAYRRLIDVGEEVDDFMAEQDIQTDNSDPRVEGFKERMIRFASRWSSDEHNIDPEYRDEIS